MELLHHGEHFGVLGLDPLDETVVSGGERSVVLPGVSCRLAVLNWSRRKVRSSPFCVHTIFGGSE